MNCQHKLYFFSGYLMCLSSSLAPKVTLNQNHATHPRGLNSEYDPYALKPCSASSTTFPFYMSPRNILQCTLVPYAICRFSLRLRIHCFVASITRMPAFDFNATAITIATGEDVAIAVIENVMAIGFGFHLSD